MHRVAVKILRSSAHSGLNYQAACPLKPKANLNAMSVRYNATSAAKEDDDENKWWEQRQDEVDRVAAYIRSLDVSIQDALRINPAEQLVDSIAEAIQTVPRVVRRTGSCLRSPMAYYHFIYHKPRGILSQPRQLGREGEVCVSKSLPMGFPPVPFAGRLDADTEGLLLFSDNGKLLHSLIAPSDVDGVDHVEKLYYVEVSYQARRFSLEPLTEEQKATVIDTAVKSMREPIDIKSSVTMPAVVEPCVCPDFAEDLLFAPLEPSLTKKRKRKLATIGAGEAATEKEVTPQSIIADNIKRGNLMVFWISVRIREGKNRQIRRLCKRAHLAVLRLIRSDLGPLSLGNLKAGEARALTMEEVEACYRMGGNAEPFPSMPCPVSPMGADLLHRVVPPLPSANSG